MKQEWDTELEKLKARAEQYDQPKVVLLLYAARGAGIRALGEVERKAGDTGKIEDQWFGIALDEFARYCHLLGITEMEQHLEAAMDVWAADQEATAIEGLLIPFRDEDS